MGKNHHIFGGVVFDGGVVFGGGDLLVKSMRWRVGNGEFIAAFKDRWIPRETTFRLITPPGLNLDVKVAEFISPSGVWRIDRLNEVF